MIMYKIRIGSLQGKSGSTAVFHQRRSEQFTAGYLFRSFNLIPEMHESF